MKDSDINNTAEVNNNKIQAVEKNLQFTDYVNGMYMCVCSVLENFLCIF